MNYISKISFAGLLLAGASANVFAVEPAIGWYAGLFVGPSFVPSTSVTITRPGFGTFHPTINYNVGVNGGGQLGYRCNKFRFEVELLGDLNSVSNITRSIAINGSTTISTSKNRKIKKGQLQMLGGLFNAFYEFYDIDYSETRWIPYIGLGIGYAQIEHSIDYNFASAPNIQFRTSLTSNAPVGQVIGGINYFFSDYTSFGTDLRYVSSNITNKSTNGRNNFNSRTSVFSWNFVLNYTFDQTNY
jgi:opacity protein-like surface antigen